MVTIPELAVPVAIIAVLLTFFLRLIEWGIRRWWESKTATRREKRQWYKELTELLKKTRITTSAYRGLLEFWNSMNPKPEETFDESDLQSLRKFLNSAGIEAPDRYIEQKAKQLLQSHRGAVQERIEMDMRRYKTELLEHLSKHPDDVDQSLLKECTKLIQFLPTIGMTGQLTTEVDEKIWAAADEVITICQKEEEELKSWFE